MRIMLNCLLISGLLLFSTTNATGASVYKWRDANGKLHFSDKEPANQKSDNITINYHVPSGNTKKKLEKQYPKIIMYTTEWCPVCKRAKKFFRRNNIPYINKDVEKSIVAKKEYKALRGTGVPLIYIGETRISGFSKARVRRILGLND